MGKVLEISLKVAAYAVFVVLAVYFAPRVLAKVLHTEYPIATITSGSMWPVLKVNDLILMKGMDGKDAEVGQIIVFKNSKGFTIHRVVRKAGVSITTKGDANNVEDSPIKTSDVVGRAVYIGKHPFRIPYLGSVARGLGPKIQELDQELQKKL